MTKEDLKDKIRDLIKQFGEKDTYQEQFVIVKLIWATLLTGNFSESDQKNIEKDMRAWIFNFQLYEHNKTLFSSVTLDLQAAISSAEFHKEDC